LTKKQGKDGGKLKIGNMKESCIKRRSKEREKEKSFGEREKKPERKRQKKTTSNSNIYPTRCNVTQFVLSGKCSTCFRWYLHPSSGAHTTVSTASGICHTVTATCR